MKDYWRRNISCVLVLLFIWFLVSYICSIVFVDQLDHFHLPGTEVKLGFWLSQQGSIFIYLVLIGIYMKYMNKLDRDFARSLKQEKQADS